MNVTNKVLLPPKTPVSQDGTKLGGWYHSVSDEQIECDLCPRHCRLKHGDQGFCFVRENRDQQMVLTTYGRSTGFCIDPVEKKPLYHFLPGNPVLSFGTAGCNLGCKFCQNWEISKSREVARASQFASPESIARAALELNCSAVAMTYNDPVIWAEYAIDTAAACQKQGLKTIVVTAGYLQGEARHAFFEYVDAANVDLKAFTESFYWKITGGHLEPVLDTLKWLYHETNVWLELTNLQIPEANDSLREIQAMCRWIVEELGPEVPLHFSAFHPDFRMTDRPATSIAALRQAYEIAKRSGLQYVYLGNVHDPQRDSTYCPECDSLLIERDWYSLGKYALAGSKCVNCGHTIPGIFSTVPGTWGPRRQPIDMRQYQLPITGGQKS